MTPTNLEAWFVILTTATVVALTAVVWLKRLPHLSTDFLFLFFFSTTVAYLDLAPLAVLVTAGARGSIYGIDVPGARAYLGEYAQMQVAALLLFQLPLLLLYFGRWRRRGDTAPVQAPAIVATRGAALVLAVACIAPVVFLAVALRNSILDIRPYGGELLTTRLVSLPRLEFAVYRTYQETVLFITGVSFIVFLRSRGALRALAGLAVLANLVAFGLYGVLSSRTAVILLAVLLTGWWLHGFPTHHAWRAAARRVLAAALVAAVLATIAVNRRASSGDAASSAGFNPFRVGLFGDNQGYARLNCVDLLARLAPPVSEHGPAWGAAWQGTTWMVRRLFDPEGFDRFRLGLRTTAKSYLMFRYLGIDAPDYYSCGLVDLFGNFSWLGFPFAAAIYGTCFRFYRAAMFRPASGTIVVLGVFVVTSVIFFDQEAATTLLGWFRTLPVLLAVVAARPLAVRQP